MNRIPSGLRQTTTHINTSKKPTLTRSHAIEDISKIESSSTTLETLHCRPPKELTPFSLDNPSPLINKLLSRYQSENELNQEKNILENTLNLLSFINNDKNECIQKIKPLIALIAKSQLKDVYQNKLQEAAKTKMLTDGESKVKTKSITVSPITGLSMTFTQSDTQLKNEFGVQQHTNNKLGVHVNIGLPTINAGCGFDKLKMQSFFSEEEFINAIFPEFISSELEDTEFKSIIKDIMNEDKNRNFTIKNMDEIKSLLLYFKLTFDNNSLKPKEKNLPADVTVLSANLNVNLGENNLAKFSASASAKAMTVQKYKEQKYIDYIPHFKKTDMSASQQQAFEQLLEKYETLIELPKYLKIKRIIGEMTFEEGFDNAMNVINKMFGQMIMSNTSNKQKIQELCILITGILNLHTGLSDGSEPHIHDKAYNQALSLYNKIIATFPNKKTNTDCHFIEETNLKTKDIMLNFNNEISGLVGAKGFLKKTSKETNDFYGQGEYIDFGLSLRQHFNPRALINVMTGNLEVEEPETNELLAWLTSVTITHRESDYIQCTYYKPRNSDHYEPLFTHKGKKTEKGFEFWKDNFPLEHIGSTNTHLKPDEIIISADNINTLFLFFHNTNKISKWDSFKVEHQAFIKDNINNLSDLNSKQFQQLTSLLDEIGIKHIDINQLHQLCKVYTDNPTEDNFQHAFLAIENVLKSSIEHYNKNMESYQHNKTHFK